MWDFELPYCFHGPLSLPAKRTYFEHNEVDDAGVTEISEVEERSLRKSKEVDQQVSPNKKNSSCIISHGCSRRLLVFLFKRMLADFNTTYVEQIPTQVILY